MLAHTVNPYVGVLWCDFRSSFQLVDKTAASDGTFTAENFDTDISQLDQLSDGVEKMGAKWATLETGGWPLDGTRKIMPEDLTGIQTGAWSEPSDENGEWAGADKPKLTRQFASDHSSYGFTLIFDTLSNWYPKSITLEVYDASNVLIDSMTLDCTSPRQVVDMAVENYRKPVLTFNSSRLPYQRVHLGEVIFGIIENHDRSNMTGATILYETDPRMKTLPCGKMVQTIDNSDGRYNMRAPNSLYAYLQKGQPFDSNEIGLGETAGALEYISMGKQFYFAKAEASENSMTADITAYDLLYQLDKGIYRRGVTGTDTVANLINAVIADSGLDIVANIPAEIGARVIGSGLPLVSHREAIRLICEAARCVAFVNRDNELQLADIAIETSVDALDGDNMQEWPDIGVDDAVNTVNVSVYRYFWRTTASVLIFSGEFDIGGTKDIWVEYDPASNVTADVTGGTLNSASYYFRAAKLNITAAGSVTIEINGRELYQAKTIYTDSTATDEDTEQPYNIDNALITSAAIAAAVATYQLGLSRVKYPVVEMGNPARELADTVTISDAYGGTGDAVVTKQKFTFDGGLKCELEAVG